jgi:hypothetical protein
MTSDLDIYRAANALIREYGDEAPINAAMRHDELLEAGDLDGAPYGGRAGGKRRVNGYLARS